MKKRIVSIVVIVALIWGNGYTAQAITSQQYKDQINTVKANSDKIKVELEDVKKDLNSALQEVSEVTDSIDNIEKEISELTSKIESLDKSISEKEEDLKEKETLLDERLAVAYMDAGTNPYLEAFFSCGFVNFISNYDMIKQIAEYDTNLIREVKNMKISLEDEKRQIEESKAQKEEKSSELKKRKAEKQKKVNSLSQDQKDLQAKIDDYDSQMKELSKKEKEQAAKEAAEAAAKIQSTKTTTSRGSNSLSSSGKFLWPVPSSNRISSPYGYRIHPIYGTRKLHAGIDIAAAGGSNILAAESGTVILSSWGYNGGYGNYIIISHGNGYTTRYAHCSNLYVKVGDSVSRGQVIAAVGTTGASTGNHLHFEVRINGESKNPMNYL